MKLMCDGMFCFFISVLIADLLVYMSAIYVYFAHCINMTKHTKKVGT